MKKLLTILSFVALCSSAQASYLYWQVDADDYSNLATKDEVNSFGLFATDGNNKYMISDYDGAAGQKMGPVDVTNYSSFSFYVELYHYNGSGQWDTLGQGSEMTYTQLKADGYILNDPLSVTQATVWHGGSYSAPEPTSGLLMLLGVAALGLKRRKA